ncbi:endonuclease domain-containing protein [Streptomyces sp. NPDC102394]|uniref:endonuclease domain-containing protein n=1 Tax=Streptomyces sp. NPDC102394 TaxID=3366167 RepID=UPI00381F8113
MGKNTTTAQGYGYSHQALRRALLPDAYGKPCPHCGKPMLRGQSLDLDHTPDRSGYRGMAHASCNRADGARRGNARRKRRWTTTRQW